MNLRTCPNCGLENQKGYSFCTKCGTKIPEMQVVEPIISEPIKNPSIESSYYSPLSEPNYSTPLNENGNYTPSKFSSSRYAALRGIASFCNGFAKAIAAVAGLAALISFSSYASENKTLLGFGSAIMFAALGGFSYVILRVIAEGISVLLDIEANTKLSATTSQEIYNFLEKDSK